MLTLPRKLGLAALPLTIVILLLAYDAAPDASNTRPAEAVSQVSASIELIVGWNLISIPVIVDNGAPDVLFASIASKLETASAYEATGSTWLTYSPSAPPS